MPKKLTMVGVLAALALGAVALFQGAGTTYAGPGGKIQNFNVSSSICYGTAPAAGSATCVAGTDTTAAAGIQYTAIQLIQGSRLTLPTQYTPAAFAYTAPAVDTVIGRITSKTDILCDGVADILSTGGPPASPSNASDPNPGTGNENGANLGTWPDATNWLGFPNKYKGVAPAGSYAYVLQTKPMPSTYGAAAFESADFYTLWLGGVSPLDLFTINGGAPSPLDIVHETLPGSYPAPAGLRVSVALLASSPNPPSTSFSTCLDSPQDSVSSSNTVGIPGAPGMYARWTVYTSSEDVRSGQIARVIDLNCTTVTGGPALTDADGDCLPSTSDPDDAVADADGDLVVDGIEAAFGTSRTAADADADGANDFAEMAQFTNPTNADTDGDGSPDLADDGADETPGSKGTITDTAIDDNCPADANPAQENTDSGAVPFTSDLSNPHQDLQGDACDDDDDNDDMTDVAEAGNESAGGPYCVPSGAANATLPLDNDTDNDIGLDGLECKYGTNPTAPLSQMALGGGDGLATEAEENFYKTQKINKPGGGQEVDIDSDGLLGDPDTDADNDKMLDGREVKFYGTEPGNNDSDQDLCSDGREIADVTGDRQVNVIDLSQIAGFRAKAPSGAGFTPGSGGYRSSVTGMVTANPGAGVPNGETFVNYDMQKDGDIDVADLQFVAPITATTPNYTPDGASVGNTQPNNVCPAQGDRGVLGTFEAVDGFSITYSNVVPVVEP